MITLLIIYLVFIIGYEHWADQSVTSKVIYFSVQYLFIAGAALTQFKKYKVISMLLSIIFVGLALNELMCLGFTNAQYMEAVNPASPVFGLTIFALALFLIYEIIQWKKRFGLPAPK